MVTIMWYCCFYASQNFSPEKLASKIKEMLVIAELNSQSVDCTIYSDSENEYKFLVVTTSEVASIIEEAMQDLGLEGVKIMPGLQ